MSSQTMNHLTLKPKREEEEEEEERRTTYQNCCQQQGLHSHDHRNANIQRGGEREESIGGNVVCECDSYEEEPEDEEEVTAETRQQHHQNLSDVP